MAQGQNPTPVESRAQTLNAADQKAMKSAMDAEDAGHPQQAESLLRDLVNRHPENFELVEALGLLYADLEKFDSAYPLLDKATRLSPSSAIAYANLGAVQLKLHHERQAVKALEKSVSLHPDNAQTQTNLGLALMQTNEPKRAAVAFEHAAGASSQDSDLFYNWGVALMAAGDLQSAAGVLSRAPNHDTSAQVQSLLGEIAEQQGKFKEAVDHDQSAVRLDPTEANIYALGLEFLRHWTFEPAMKIFDYGLSLYPQSARLLTGQGIAKYANDNYAEAAQIFASLLSKDPDNALYAKILGNSCNLMPDSIEGCNTLVDFARNHPTNATAATFAAASILHRPTDATNLALAQTLLDRAIAEDPYMPDAYFQLGVLKQQKGEWPESAAALEKCLSLRPRLSKAHYRLALAYSHMAEKDKAREQFALQQQYSQEEKDDLNARLKEVTTFLVENH
jgi:tetratricopeptide (TPR) repeat protein